jgi:hypothetical protein
MTRIVIGNAETDSQTLLTYQVGCSSSDEKRLYVFSFEAGMVSETTESLQTDFKISLCMTLLLNLLSITAVKASFRQVGVSSVLILVGEKLLTLELFRIKIAVSTTCMQLMLISFMIMYDAAKGVDCRQAGILLACTIVSPANRALQITVRKRCNLR